ncbi:MAG TPA: HD domain-containing phosphohydrolase [Patescibacteria group bacterium]|nr:HD domain-containing phosphohydrolase [Patescibacteria group bacterium]
MIFSIHPSNLVAALSTALELSTRGLSRHHWRTAMLADRLAGEAGMPEKERQQLFYAALLHDLGAASNWAERRKLVTLKVGDDVYQHAENGYLLLKDSTQLGVLADIIRHHHDRWDGNNLSRLAGKDIPLASRIINLADRLEILIRDNVDIFEQRPQILSALRELSGTYFDPDLVKCLHGFARQESFWLDLTNASYYQNFFRDTSGIGYLRFSVDDVRDIAEIFATIIDRTSRFTGIHSRAVAMVAAFLAEVIGFSTDEVKMIRIAGLFHDLGKLAVPNEILEKPGKLTSQELAVIRQHPYYTYRILEQIDGFELICEWAAFHHETLDGGGYPFRHKMSSLKLGSRIVSVADVFVALTENRPYRSALPIHKVEHIIREMVNNRKLDGNIAAALFSNRDAVSSLMDNILRMESRPGPLGIIQSGISEVPENGRALAKSG